MNLEQAAPLAGIAVALIGALHEQAEKREPRLSPLRRPPLASFPEGDIPDEVLADALARYLAPFFGGDLGDIPDEVLADFFRGQGFDVLAAAKAVKLLRDSLPASSPAGDIPHEALADPLKGGRGLLRYVADEHNLADEVLADVLKEAGSHPAFFPAGDIPDEVLADVLERWLAKQFPGAKLGDIVSALEAAVRQFGLAEQFPGDKLGDIPPEVILDYLADRLGIGGEEVEELKGAQAPPSPPPWTRHGATKNEALGLMSEVPLADGHATVRYYNRMNPDRVYPLLVAITENPVQPVAGQPFDQQSGTFAAAVNAVVEVEPILPGCKCYPARQSVSMGGGDAKLRFDVVPRVLGAVLAARVVLRDKNSDLAEIPLDVRVVSKKTTVLLVVGALIHPFVSAVLKHFKVDFESQLQDGFGRYISVARLALDAMTPEVLAGVLMAGAAGAYLWARPRKRDTFWDLATIVADPPEDEVETSEVELIRFLCANCGKRCKAPVKAVGRKGSCPRCGQGLEIPAPTEALVSCPGCGRSIPLLPDEQSMGIECAKCGTRFVPTRHSASSS
jgi:hypothetical protein